MIGRRQFLRTGLAGAGAVLATKALSPLGGAQSGGTEARIEILLDEPLGVISPNIYGHFVENLSGVVYDGVWVGPNSKVPNVDGIRKELIDEMRKINPAVVRFPGGCFADSYDWRDGVGPTNKRPKRTNFWAGGENSAAPASHRYDPNEFGTNEFAHFCKLIGAEPYLAANLRSLPAEEFYRWVEYCNSPADSTTLAALRADAGFKEPFNVRYWGVGNEAWGCGGNFTAQEYAVEFRRFTTWVPRVGRDVSFIGSGPNVDNWAWTRGFFEEIVKKGRGELRSIYGWALHHYAWNLSRGKTEDWNQGKGDALQFDAVDWYELLREGDRMEGLINGHWQVMGEEDPEHWVKLVVDEWGPWDKPGSEATPGDQLEQMPTLRDAAFSGMTLDIFNRHAEEIAMANCAREGKPASFGGLKASTSLRDKDLTLTVVNPDVGQARDAQIMVRGAKLKAATATVLTNPDIHAHNTFTEKDVVAPRTQTAEINGNVLNFRFAPASVTKLAVQLM